MSAQHTPGPWVLGIQGHTRGLAKGLQTGWVIGPAGHIEASVPDARLIAAAPDLLAALEVLVEEIDFEIEQRQDGGNAEDWLALQAKSNRAHEAIAKAKGPTP